MSTRLRPISVGLRGNGGITININSPEQAKFLLQSKHLLTGGQNIRKLGVLTSPIQPFFIGVCFSAASVNTVKKNNCLSYIRRQGRS